MKKAMPLKKRMMLTTSLLLLAVGALFAVFSVFNFYVNIVRPFEQTHGVPAEGAEIVIDASKYFQANVLFLLAVMAAGCALTYFAARYALSPLRAWSEEMADIDHTSLSRRMERPGTGDELDVLADAFNRLLDRLQAAFEREKRFSAAAAHELKTPLTVIRANIEVLQLDEHPSEEDCAQTMDVVARQTERMTRLVGDLLLLSGTGARTQGDAIDMDALLGEIAQDAAPALAAKNIALTYERRGAVLSGNAVLIRHAVNNLVENAIKYNVPGGCVEIAQRAQAGTYALDVIDTGVGISSEDAPYIFEPFYRADPSRNRAEGGSGLGLAIAKEIVESHGGSIRCRANEPQGCVMSITLPM